ncbi:MAG: M24 family metallopeptidase [Nitrospinota bacterium]
MAHTGAFAVDWEERFNMERLRRERLEKAHAAMEKFDVDALLFLRWENTRYVSGHRFIAVPTGVCDHPVVCLLPRGGKPILYTIDMDLTKEKQPWIPEENVREAYFPEQETGAQGLAEALKRELGADFSGRLGVDTWTAAMYEAIPPAFPKARFVNGYEVIMDARMIKTTDEIECLKIAYAITEAGFQAGIEALRPGVRECEVQAAIWGRVYSLGAEWTQSAGIVTSDTAPYRRFTSDKIILEGEAVVIDIGAVFNGYFCDTVRTWFCGLHKKPTPEQKALFRQSYDALRRAEEAIKPGVTTGDVYASVQDRILGRLLGHGIGLGGQELPWIAQSPEEAMVIQPGMVFCIEPFVGKKGLTGIRLEDNVIVTEDGHEVYSTFSFGPLAE